MKKIYIQIKRFDIVTTIIYLGFAYLIKALWRRKVSLNIQSGIIY